MTPPGRAGFVEAAKRLTAREVARRAMARLSVLSQFLDGVVDGALHRLRVGRRVSHDGLPL